MPKLTEFELRSMPGLWRWYDLSGRKLAFEAASADEAMAWQHTLRGVLTRLLGMRSDACSLDPVILESVRENGFTRELVVMQTFPGEYMPCYVLIPDSGPRPFTPIIALHGHGTLGAHGLIMIDRTRDTHKPAAEMNADYARQLALRGYLVFVPVLRGFAERLEDREAALPKTPEEQAWLSSCKLLSMNALMYGKTLLGMRVWDVQRLIDYVRTRPEPMTDSLGCVGLSGGGTVTLFAAALDARIKCSVVSGYFNTFRESIMSIDHCVCNYIPGILEYAEMSDIAGLIAPRPLLIESGLSDPIYPAAGTRQALSQLQPIYHVFGADDALDSDLFPGGHQWSGAKAYDWLERWL